MLCSVKVPIERRKTAGSSSPLPPPMTHHSPENPPSSPGEFRFEVMSPELKKAIVFKTETEEERQEWMKAIQLVVSSQINTNQKEETETKSVSHLFYG